MNKPPLFSYMQVELQSNCNRDCVFCPRYLDRSGIRKTLEGKAVYRQAATDAVLSIIDQAADLGFRGSISFHRLSESFLDNRYLEIAQYVKKRGLSVWDHTNGDIFLANPGIISKIDGVVDLLGVGLYDYTTYAEKQQQMEFWRKQFKKTRVYFSLPLEFPHPRGGTDLQAQALQSPSHRSALKRPCREIGVSIQVRYDGEVTPCCHDDLALSQLGNAFRSPVKDIWWGERHVRMWEALQKPNSRQLFPACKDCVVSARPPLLLYPFKRIFDLAARVTKSTAFRMGLISTTIQADPLSAERAAEATARALTEIGGSRLPRASA